MAEATAEVTEEPTEQLSWKEKIARNWFNVRLGHEGMMLDKIQQQQKRVFEIADRAANGTTGKPSQSAGDDDMGVNIGNEIHYHGVQQAASTVTNTGTPGLSTAAKAALVVALLGGAGGVGYAAADLLKPEPAVVQGTDTDTDTDTITEMDFPK